MVIQLVDKALLPMAYAQFNETAFCFSAYTDKGKCNEGTLIEYQTKISCYGHLDSLVNEGDSCSLVFSLLRNISVVKLKKLM